jgi:hypothetical protein
MLAGCTQPPTPAADPGTPEESPTAEAATRPRPSLEIGCTGLLALETVQAQVTAEISLRIDETTPIAGLDGTAQLQAGGMRCAWAGENRTDNSFDDGLQLDILPDATDDFVTASTDSSFDGMTAVDDLGDEAYRQCDTVVAICRIQVLVDGYWVSAQFSDSDYPTSDAPTHAATASVELLGAAVEAIRAVPAPAPVWQPPQTGDSVCTEALAAPIGGAIGADPAGFTRASTDGPLWLISTAAARRLGVERCSWQNDTQWLGRLPGGGWAVEVAPDAAAGTFLDGLTIEQVAGVGDVAIACGQGCVAWFAHDGDLVEYAWYPENDLAYREDMKNQVAAIAPVLG